MAWAVRAIQIGKPKFCFFLMGLTFMGGVGFMIVKSIEYTQKFEHGLGPGAWYVAPAEAAELAKMREEAAGPQAPAAAPAAPPAFGTGLAKPAASPSGMVDPAMRTGAHGHHGSGEPIMVNGREDPYAEMGQTPEDLTIARPFFSIYFAMTALHGLHVLVGMGLIAWVMIRVKSGEFSPEFNTPVDLVGLYWHLVDLIWIFLFPLLYLIH
ncbi:MAG: hypothetical protein GC162_04405 [Planctomycetes bacterium]|nr:hypothetical protein [Planctomycetota bacterium]